MMGEILGAAGLVFCGVAIGLLACAEAVRICRWFQVRRQSPRPVNICGEIIRRRYAAR